MLNAASTHLKNEFIEIIIGRILSGALKPGDRLPPERELASQVGISRGSVNQGVLDLERMGFLRIVPRKGTYVAEYLKNATPETLSAIMGYDSDLISSYLFRDLMELRILIERECVRLACGRMGSDSIAALEARNAEIYKAEGTELINALYLYHNCIVKLSGNAAYLMIFQSFEKVIRNLIGAHYENKNELNKCLPFYSELSRALISQDAPGADEYISKILGFGSEYLNILLAQREDNGL